MITWIRPSGTEITTNDNDATVSYARSLGWKEKEDGPKSIGQMTKAELVEVANEAGADFKPSDSKKEILAAIKAKLEEEETE